MPVEVAEELRAPMVRVEGIEVIVSALIENGDGEVLLIRQDAWPNVWTLPGGHLEPGESLEAGALREGEEETGLSLESRGLVDWGELIDQLPNGHGRHFLYFDFAFRSKSSQLFLDAREIREGRWVMRESLLEYSLSPGYRKSILKYLKDL